MCETSVACKNTLTYLNFTNSASQTVCVLGTLPVHLSSNDSFFQVLECNVDVYDKNIYQ